MYIYIFLTLHFHNVINVHRWNDAYFKWLFNINKLNKYFDKIDEEWKNLVRFVI